METASEHLFNYGAIIAQESGKEGKRYRAERSAKLVRDALTMFIEAENRYRSDWIRCFKEGRSYTSALPGLISFSQLFSDMDLEEKFLFNQRLIKLFNIKLRETDSPIRGVNVVHGSNIIQGSFLAPLLISLDEARMDLIARLM